MALTNGARLGSYEIVAPLGQGGMGEVYQARDTKLNRDVAIKVLPHLFAGDRERRARFEREAQLLASLNHPHIAAIYGFEESHGVGALVMELVQGETLAERLARVGRALSGPPRMPDPIGSGLPLDEAIAIARQIADALEAAHEKGIVHRDLKPANIKVAADGRVKVLDFGLAKALDPASSVRFQPELTASPTLTSPAMTGVGMLLGTAAYMAPEQARGAAVDKRADIWAFGVVLFEMLIGKRLFEGGTVSDTLAAVLRQDVDWSLLPATTPPAIARLLRRCLERDSKRRLRDIGEARIALETPASEPAQTPAAAAAPTARSRFGVIHLTATILVVALAGVSAVSLVLWRSRSVADGSIARVSASLPAEVSFNLGNRPAVAISRDGSKLVFVGTTKNVDQLFVRLLNEFEPRLLAGTEGASGPFFSPDGGWIGFFADGKLQKIAVNGGPVITLANATDPRGAVWSDQDTILFSPDTTTPIYEVPAAGGTIRPISTLDEKKHERTHRWPSLLPDGKSLLFTVGSLEHPDDYDDASIEAIRLGTGERKVVLKGGRMGQYLPTGDLVFLRGRVLYAVAFDDKRLEPRGSPRPVVDGVSGDTTTGAAHYSVSDTGTLVYLAGDPSGSAARRLTWVDKQGKVAFIDAPPAFYSDPHVSPDGRRIAVTILEITSSNKDIWIVDTTRGTSSRLTFGGINRTPIWSRDGMRVYFVAYDAARSVSTVMMKAADGSGDAERFREISGQAYLGDLSGDGGTLMAMVNNPTTKGKFVLYRFPVKGGEPAVVAPGPSAVVDPAISPDGRWLAYAAAESGRLEVYVQSFVSSGGRSQVSNGGGWEPHWASDGRALYYQQNSEMMMVPLESGSGFVPGRPTSLFGGILQFFVDSRETYNVAPRGDRFVMMKPVNDRGSVPEMRISLNWFAELRRPASR